MQRYEPQLLFATSNPLSASSNPAVGEDGLSSKALFGYLCVMRYTVTVLYWGCCTLFLATILSSLGYAFGDSLFVASMFLPGLLLVKILLPQLLRETGRRRWLHGFYLTAALLVLEYLLLFWVNRDLAGFGRSMDFPPLLLNPLFLLFLTAALSWPERALDRRCASCAARRPRTVDFFSERRRISLPEQQIRYVASNDAEVAVHTLDGTVYRTRTPISQWEAVLSEACFLRIHRAYIVNRACVVHASRTACVVGEETLPVSRKYAERTVRELPG